MEKERALPRNREMGQLRKNNYGMSCRGMCLSCQYLGSRGRRITSNRAIHRYTLNIQRVDLQGRRGGEGLENVHVAQQSHFCSEFVPEKKKKKTESQHSEESGKLAEGHCSQWPKLQMCQESGMHGWMDRRMDGRTECDPSGNGIMC